jgi:hypothetical protein
MRTARRTALTRVSFHEYEKTIDSYLFVSAFHNASSQDPRLYAAALVWTIIVASWMPSTSKQEIRMIQADRSTF